ncbi:hypothetical protein FQN54_002101 [Arachnomyces sp. PD_36]|nr:hypothetical protein FQN54_002101 [Arachnomyces sp. PD_36]
MPTLLQYLSTVDPDLDRTNVKTGMNSFNPEWDVVEGIREWTDFTYENMITMLGDTLTSMYQSSQFDMPTQLRRPTLQIVDETTVAAVLLKWNHTIVDRALQLASSTRNLRSMSWALGAHADISGQVIFPDWAGIDLDSTFPASNRVPGDTKVSGKWNTDMQQKEEDDTDEFFKPLRQVIHYARLFNTRYAYVISDKELYTDEKGWPTFTSTLDVFAYKPTQPLFWSRDSKFPAAAKPSTVSYTAASTQT